MKSIERFSSRVENYVKFRPHYPVAVLEFLKIKCGLGKDSIVADIGSGTGILSKLFLEMGCEVLGVEPNREMREAGEHFLSCFPKFHSCTGTAEETGLSAKSVDFIVAGQAFHWFDRERTHKEFTRILKPQGWVVLIWNDRRTESSPFLQSYENLLQKFATDYNQVNHRYIDDEVIGSFFGKNNFQKATFDNQQFFDLEGLKGRLLSSSYIPDSGEKFAEMIRQLKMIFECHQSDGKIFFDYDTVIYFGNLAG